MRTQMSLERIHSPGFDRRALFSSPQPHTPGVIVQPEAVHDPPNFDSDGHEDSWMHDYEMDPIDGISELGLGNDPTVASPSMTTGPLDELDMGESIAHETEYHPIINGMISYFILEIRPDQFYVGEPCNIDGSRLADPTKLPPPVTQDDSDWAPFESRLAFETADFFYRVDQMSAAKIDKILELWAESLAVHGDEPPFQNHVELYKAIDAISVGGVPWKSHTFTYEGQKPPSNAPKWMTGEYTIFYRDPRKLFIDMLGNPDFAKDVDYSPLRQYDGKGIRQYENFMSGDWAWKQAVTLFFLINLPE